MIWIITIVLILLVLDYWRFRRAENESISFLNKRIAEIDKRIDDQVIRLSKRIGSVENSVEKSKKEGK